MKVNIILWLVVMSVFYLSACENDESIKENALVDISYLHRFYIDPDNGAYYNTGHSPDQAWESVDRFSERTWKAGDTILIKRGTVYNGSLKLKGNGSAEAPIVIGSYGDESLPLPVIDGAGQVEATITAHNVEYWEIHNLCIRNKGTEPQARAKGILLEANDFGEMNHIHIKGCVISDIYGSKAQSNGGGAGIYLYNVLETATPSFFNDILIEECLIKDCQRNAITGFISTGDRSKLKKSTNVVVRRNIIERVPGDAIVIVGCEGALVEENVVKDCAMGDFAPEDNGEAAAGVWCIHSDNTVFRYNIVQDHKATWDGQAFDCDQNCVNTLYEYNISYNNVGGFFLLCPLDNYFNQGYAEHKGTVVRYNISINDGTRNYLKDNGKVLSSTIDVAGRAVDCHFYNNTIIKTKSADAYADNSAITLDSYQNIPSSLRFTNNIFYNTTGVYNQFIKITQGELEENRGIILQNNCIYGYDESTIPGTGEYNTGLVTENPKFVQLVADFIENNNLVDKEKILQGLCLASGSPCFGTGKIVETDGIFPLVNDFWGNSIGDTRNIGAFNH